MPYCEHCGAEVGGNFCPNCGAPTNAGSTPVPLPIIHKDVEIKARYNTFSIILAGWAGLACLIMTLAFLIYGVFFASKTFSDVVSFLFAAIFCGVLTFLCYLPGISTIRKRTPKGEVMSTFRSFFIKSLLFFFAWGVTAAGCVYIVGIFFKVWRFGLWASRVSRHQYTAFVNGEKISVTQYYDDLPDYGPRGDWVYMDRNGEFYRPPV